jgi:uncharacterized protein (DUF433 family)
MSTPTTPQVPGPWQYLEPNPKSAYRQLFLKGTRVRADVVYQLSLGREPMTPEEIAADYNWPLGAVKEAIAYCAAHPPEVAEDRRRDELARQVAGMNDPDYKLGGRYKILSPQDRARLGL